MLVAKGYKVACYVGEEGRSLHRFAAPPSYAMLHDPDGTAWPSGSVLVASFSKTGKGISYDLASDYFGADPLGGEIELPPKSLREWMELGPCEKIEYTRMRPHGLPAKYEGDYYHFFDGSEGLLSVLSLFFKAPRPVLYRRRRMLRLELPAWAELDDRGFCWP